MRSSPAGASPVIPSGRRRRWRCRSRAGPAKGRTGVAASMICAGFIILQLDDGNARSVRRPAKLLARCFLQTVDLISRHVASILSQNNSQWNVLLRRLVPRRRGSRLRRWRGSSRWIRAAFRAASAEPGGSLQYRSEGSARKGENIRMAPTKVRAMLPGGAGRTSMTRALVAPNSAAAHSGTAESRPPSE